MDTVSIPVKAKPHDPENKEVKNMDLAIVPPHLLTVWLLGNRTVAFNPTPASAYWRHMRERGVPWMSGPDHEHPELSHHFQPVALYADEAEYTVSKEKITILYMRTLHDVGYIYVFIYPLMLYWGKL